MRLFIDMYYSSDNDSQFWCMWLKIDDLQLFRAHLIYRSTIALIIWTAGQPYDLCVLIDGHLAYLWINRYIIK